MDGRRLHLLDVVHVSKEVENFWDTLPMLWGRFAIVREARESLSFYSVFFSQVAVRSAE
jgi:hypothetical protein